MMDTGFNRGSWCGSIVLTVDVLESMEEGIFVRGEEFIPEISPDKKLRWVAVRGGIADWAIYCHLAYNSFEFVHSCGDKIFDESVIRKLVPCTDEAWERYRF